MIGYVYQIVYQDTNRVIRYIGSTEMCLTYRFSLHKAAYRSWLSGKVQRCCSIYPYFNDFGVENFRIIELIRYDVEDTQELRKYEQEWIDKLDCVNKNGAVLQDRKVREEKIKEKQIWYCYECEKSFPTYGTLRNHYDSVSHWQEVFPFRLDYNMKRSEMEWEKIQRREEEKRIRQDRQNNKRRTEEGRTKQREYANRPEVKERMAENWKRHSHTEKGKATIQRYRQSEKGKKALEKRKQRYLEEKTYYCESCDKAFISKQSLTYHMTSSKHSLIHKK